MAHNARQPHSFREMFRVREPRLSISCMKDESCSAIRYQKLRFAVFKEVNGWEVSL